MLDKSIENIKVIMVKYDTSDYPSFLLPPGFSFELYKRGYEKYWAEIMHCVGEVDSIKEGLALFEKTFLADEKLAHEKCIFVFDEYKNPAATASLWVGDDLGKSMQRVHWVATDHNYQGKGLMKALLTKILEMYNKLECAEGIYLTTQTWSYKAINVYLKFGFKPYIGDVKRSKMNCFSNKRAWEIIYSEIEKYKAT